MSTKNCLIYTISYGFVSNQRAPLMVKSMRELGKFEGDIVIYSDSSNPVPGATVVHRPELQEVETIMAVRWLLGKHMDVSKYEYVAMVDTDVVAIRPVEELFTGHWGFIRVPIEHHDCWSDPIQGDTPWSVPGVVFDETKPVHNCGTVFGHASIWNKFSDLMWKNIKELKPRFHPPYPWIDQQILNHIERHGWFPIQSLAENLVFICRRTEGVSPQTKMVHCIPGGDEKMQLMSLAYSLALESNPEKA